MPNFEGQSPTFAQVTKGKEIDVTDAQFPYDQEATRLLWVEIFLTNRS
jgi:hypothetical protein